MPLSAEDVDVTGFVTTSFALVYVLNAGEDSNAFTSSWKDIEQSFPVRAGSIRLFQ